MSSVPPVANLPVGIYFCYGSFDQLGWYLASNQVSWETYTEPNQEIITSCWTTTSFFEVPNYVLVISPALEPWLKLKKHSEPQSRIFIPCPYKTTDSRTRQSIHADEKTQAALKKYLSRDKHVYELRLYNLEPYDNPCAIQEPLKKQLELAYWKYPSKLQHLNRCADDKYYLESQLPKKQLEDYGFMEWLNTCCTNPIKATKKLSKQELYTFFFMEPEPIYQLILNKGFACPALAFYLGMFTDQAQHETSGRLNLILLFSAWLKLTNSRWATKDNPGLVKYTRDGKARYLFLPSTTAIKHVNKILST